MRRDELRYARALGLLPALLLAACSDLYWDRRDTVAFQAGNANASNIAVQTIDPWPAAAANRHIEGYGPRVEGAVERYRTNKVIPPQSADTSSVKYAPLFAAPPAAAAGNGAPNQ